MLNRVIETDVVLQLQMFHVEQVKESGRNWSGIAITNFSTFSGQ